MMEVSDASDDQLWRVCRKLPFDFEPYGERKREFQPDCSTCLWFQPLPPPGQLDWGTCANPHSPRAGLLTFWEQGCEHFEHEKEPGSVDMRRNRSDLKDAVENILCDALGAFTRVEIAKLNSCTQFKNIVSHACCWQASTNSAVRGIAWHWKGFRR
jgi:hypothetical protein